VATGRGAQRVRRLHVPVPSRGVCAPHGIFDRLCHVAGEDFNDDDLLGAYVEAERGVLWENLPVDIVVPIALLTFEDDRRSLTTRAAIERLSDHEQLARVPTTYSVAAVPQPLIGAATHAFVLASWTIENGNHWAWRLDRPDAYPLEQVEACFEALRLATGLRTGYTQIYMRPKGWSQSWTAHLPPVVSGPIVRRYPRSFDDFGWLRKPTSVNRASSRRTAASYAARSSRQRASPSSAARAVDPTMSENMTVASTRSGSAAERAPVRNSSISPRTASESPPHSALGMMAPARFAASWRRSDQQINRLSLAVDR